MDKNLERKKKFAMLPKEELLKIVNKESSIVYGEDTIELVKEILKEQDFYNSVEKGKNQNKPYTYPSKENTGRNILSGIGVAAIIFVLFIFIGMISLAHSCEGDPVNEFFDTIQ